MLNKPITVDPEDLIGTDEAANMLGISAREIRFKIGRGNIPAVKIGTTHVIHKQAIIFYQRTRELKKKRVAERKQKIRERKLERQRNQSQ